MKNSLKKVQYRFAVIYETLSIKKKSPIFSVTWIIPASDIINIKTISFFPDRFAMSDCNAMQCQKKISLEHLLVKPVVKEAILTKAF